MEIRHCTQCSEYTVIHQDGKCKNCYQPIQNENFGSNIVTAHIDPENFTISYDIESIYLFE